MSDRARQTSPQVYARAAGVLYLVIIVFGIGAEVLVRGSLIVPGDAAATATNVAGSPGLFRLGFLGDSIAFVCDVALAVLLYVLLEPVGKTLALIAAAFRLTQTAVIALNLISYYSALLILDGAGYAAAFDPAQLNALAALALDKHAHGYDLGLIFFGASCVVLGALIVRSGYLPKWLGALVALAGIVYLAGSYALFLAPDLAAAIQPAYAIPLVSEVALCLWLLIRGVNVERWRARAGTPVAA
jgi:hypothetical protein